MKLDQDFYTASDIAEMLGKSVKTIKRWVREGTFPAPGKAGVWSRRVLAAILLDGQATDKQLAAIVEARA